MRTLSVDIEVLDLVLGGGLTLLERVEGAGESAMLLIRGLAGSGKTVLGTQFAANIARALHSDVAYGCIDLLPPELSAQHEALRHKNDHSEVVFLGDANSMDPGPTQVRIYAGLLNLGSDEPAARFGDAVEALMNAAAEKSRKVRVLVIDSLSDGHDLGMNASRALADRIIKFAARRGLILILLEAQAREGASAWCSAVDTVFELKSVGESTSFERKLLVSKNRFGPSDSGPHEFMIRPRSGVMILPRVKAYQRPWRYEVLRQRRASVEAPHPWAESEDPQRARLPNFRSTTTAVLGRDSKKVRQVALRLGRGTSESEAFGQDIRFVVGRTAAPMTPGVAKEDRGWLDLTWGPLQSGPLSLFTVIREIRRQSREERVPKRVIIGDLADFKYNADSAGVVEAISVLASVLRDLKIPLVLYETIGLRQDNSMAAVTADVLWTCLEDGPGIVIMEETADSSSEEQPFRLDTDRNSETFFMRI